MDTKNKTTGARSARNLSSTLYSTASAMVKGAALVLKEY